MELTFENKNNKILINEDDSIVSKEVYHPSDPIEVIYQEPNEAELEMLKGTKSIQEILDEEAIEQKLLADRKKDIIDMVKICSLVDLSYKYDTNPSYLSQLEKNHIIAKMEEYLKLEEEEIREKFNKVCLDKIFINNDYTNSK
jgi:hypothetical protein